MKLRSIDGAYEELKRRDSETAITKFFIRKLLTEGYVPSVRSGNKWLVDVDVLEKYLSGECS